MKKTYAFLATAETLILAIMAIVANFLLNNTEPLVDYQIFGAVAVLTLSALTGAWLAYVLAWCITNKAEAAATAAANAGR